MMQLIADDGHLKEDDSNSFSPLVDSLRFEVKFKVWMDSSYFIHYSCCLLFEKGYYLCCLGWS